MSTKGEEYFYGKISDIIQKVAKYQFIQIHRSYIINYAHTRVFRYDEVVMSNSITLPISQLRRKKLEKLQITYQKKN